MANMNPVYGKWDYEYIQTYALRSAFKKHYCKNQHNQKKKHVKKCEIKQTYISNKKKYI